MKVFFLMRSARVSSSKAQSTKDSTVLLRSQELGHRQVYDLLFNRPMFYQDCENSLWHIRVYNSEPHLTGNEFSPGCVQELELSLKVSQRPRPLR